MYIYLTTGVMLLMIVTVYYDIYLTKNGTYIVVQQWEKHSEHVAATQLLLAAAFQI